MPQTGSSREVFPAAGRWQAEERTDTYIVQLIDPPLAGWSGPFDPDGAPRSTKLGYLADRAANRYLAYLAARQESFLQRAHSLLGRPVVPLHRYRFAFHGLALALTTEEAQLLAELPEVARITPGRLRRLATDVGPRWIGAEAIWDGRALGQGVGSMGEGVVVGIIDTGIRMDHPSFAAVGGDGYRAQNPLGPGRYLGFCDPKHPAYRPEYRCNDKLIGAWSFPEAGNDPQDDNGHGTHTAAIAAGNVVTALLFPGSPTSSRVLSGVAPHANLVAYDACRSDGYCPDSALLAAVDTAVEEGVVDVLSFSIESGLVSPWQSPLALAFLHAHRSGILVAVAAGNGGPEPMSVEGTPPWVVSVGATTHGRVGVSVLGRLRGGAALPPPDLPGLAYSGAYGPAPIVYARGYRSLSGQPDDGRCLYPFPTGTFDGQIVVCDRGGVPRVDKGRHVLSGGAGGLVLVNTAADGEEVWDDWHVLPAVHLGYSAGQRLKDWLDQGRGHEGRIEGTRVVESAARGDRLATFSGRGPTRLLDCCYGPDRTWAIPGLLEILKPDLTAPGVEVLAAAASPAGAPFPADYRILSGTSMAAPHVAGALALLRAVRPAWTPSQIHSALMMTAAPVRLEDEQPAEPTAGGSGRVDLRAAARSALLMAVRPDDYPAADPRRGGDPKQLNLASLVDGWCLGTCHWRRTVSSAVTRPVTWTVEAMVSAPLTITVTPRFFALPGQAEQELLIAADVRSAPLGQWLFGQVTLTPAQPELPTVRIPLVVRSMAAKVPERVIIEARSAVGTYRLERLAASRTTELALCGLGFVPATPHTFALRGDPTNSDPFDGLPSAANGIALVQVSVPPGARRLIAEVTASEAGDIDLYVGSDQNADGLPSNQEVRCASRGESWPEYCEIRDPAPGTWWVVAQSFTPSDRPPDRTVVQVAVLASSVEGTMVLRGPSKVEAGQPFALTIDWRLPSLSRGDRWYGLLTLGSGPGKEEDLGIIPVDLVAMSEERKPGRLHLPLALRGAPLRTEPALGAGR